MSIYCFSSNFHPLVLASTCGSCLKQLLLYYLPNGSSVFFILFILNCNSFVRKNCPFPFSYLPNYLFIPVWTDAYLFYLMGFNPMLSLFISLLKLFDIGHWHFFRLAPMHSYKIPFFFRHFIIFWYHKIFQAQLLLSLPKPWNQLFLQGALVFFSGECCLENKHWEVGELPGTGAILLLDPLGQQRQEADVRLLTYAYTHTCPSAFPIHQSIH